MNKLIFGLLAVICISACNRSPEFYFKRANLSVSRGKELQAIQDYNKAILLKKNFPEALTARGMIYERQGDKQKAIIDYNKAINMNSGYIPAYNNIAALLMDGGNYEEAVKYLTQALEVDRDYSYALLNRGLAYYKLKNYASAKADLSKAIKLNPKFEMGFYHRALCYRRENNIASALEDLNAVLSLNPAAALAWLERGKIRFSMKDYQGASQDFSKADELSVNNDDLREDTSYWLALATYKIGYYEKALESALLSDELTPDSFLRLGLIGDIYLKFGDKNNAVSYYKRAESLAGRRAGFYKQRLAAIK